MCVCVARHTILRMSAVCVCEVSRQCRQLNLNSAPLLLTCVRKVLCAECVLRGVQGAGCGVRCAVCVIRLAKYSCSEQSKQNGKKNMLNKIKLANCE